MFVRGGRVDSNPLNFNVFKPGRPFFTIHLPELLLEPARTRLGTIIKYEVSVTDPVGSYSVQCEPQSGVEITLLPRTAGGDFEP